MKSEEANRSLLVHTKKTKYDSSKFALKNEATSAERVDTGEVSYLVGFFDNLMEGGEDAECTTMVVEVKGERGGGQDDRQTDRQGVSAGTGIWGSDTHREAAQSGNYSDIPRRAMFFLALKHVSHVL